MVDASGPPHPSLSPVCQMDNSTPRELSLYNGVSNRSRGWKTKKSDKVVEMRPSRKSSVMRWDGASMSSSGWDSLKRDPELWHRDGNCFIHLYGQRQSRRGPAFKVPFSRLLEAKCYPFIDRFMARIITTPTSGIRMGDGDLTMQSRIELFIPGPPQPDKQQSYKYQLATRNFVAFVFRRSMVGESLGAALITLMHSIHEFRAGDVDNVQDLMDYLDEEGYLNLKNSPTHALAILRLAEAFRLKDLYIGAFAHCCGMSDQLHTVPEYQHISPTSRKLIRCARVEMNLRLGRSASLLGTFLQHELAETHLSLYPGARAHLERFRSLLRDYYVAKFDSYPPPPLDPRTTAFDADVFQEMRTDFDALFQYLVDETFDTTQDSPFLAQGGICTWQSIQSFDMRHEFKTLFHPLPLLPKVSQEKNRKITWFGKRMKPTEKQREVTHSALLEATNETTELLKNGLVRVYRQFEEGSVYSPTKADRLENMGPMDGRKVRWILVYAIYQTLRQATEIPPEVRDTVGAPYHLCISTAGLPPWGNERPVHSLVRRQTEHIFRDTSPLASKESINKMSARQRSFEIKPDIDYFAITHRQDTTNDAKERSLSLRKAGSWRGSLSRSLSRGLPARHSSTKITKPQRENKTPLYRKTQYHEIVVQGYGNGTNGITAIPLDMPPHTTHMKLAEEDLALTSSSRYSSNSDLRASEEGSTAKTSETSVSEDQTEAPNCSQSGHLSSTGSIGGVHREDRYDAPSRQDGPASTRVRRKLYKEPSFDAYCGLAKRRSKSADGESRKFTEPTPLNIRRVSSVASHIEMPTPKAPMAWDHVKAIMEVKASNWMANDVQPEWEQYTDLGGLTQLRYRGPVAVPPKLRSTPAAHPQSGQDVARP